MTMYAALMANGAQCPEDGRYEVEDHQWADFQEWMQRRNSQITGQ